jgi:hypothetical protein
MAEKHAPRRADATAVTNVHGQRFADVRNKGQRFHDPSFPTYHNLTRPPVNIVAFQKNHFARTKANQSQ